MDLGFFFFSWINTSEQNCWVLWASLVAQTVKKLPAVWETWVQSLVWTIPWGGNWQPTLVFLPREFHGQRSLASYIPLCCRESDMPERLILIYGKSIFNFVRTANLFCKVAIPFYILIHSPGEFLLLQIVPQLMFFL